MISLVTPRNTKRFFLLQPAFLQKALAVAFAFFIWFVWYNHSTTSLATVFSPFLSPLSERYIISLADYYTTGEGRSPAFLPTLLVVLAIIAFVGWRFWYHYKQWKKSKDAIVSLMLICCLPFLLSADAPVQPPKVETSVGIYDVQSKEEIHNFTAEEIRTLMQMEDDRTRGSGLRPHPVLVYCFEERSFPYTGGKYDNAEIKYRLRVPKKIVRGKKYPLVVHLHGIGESGDDNRHSLAHLHSILPLLIGPEQQDFFLLVLQCPRDDRVWTFKPTKDGNLDVVVALTEHVIQNNPIDERRLSTFGLSSGGYGVWQWITAYPEKFAAAAPAATTFPGGKHKSIPELRQTPVWVFVNQGDGGVAIPPLQEAIRYFEASNGFMKLTRLAQGGHASWRPAMDDYNCFAWMIAQKRGNWFNPPPERKIYQGRSLANSLYAFFLPLGLAAGLFVFQRTPHCERSHERIAKTLTKYLPNKTAETEASTTSQDGFRMWSGITGTKQFKAKIVGFQGDSQVRIQSPEGKIVTAPIKQFCDADQELIRKMQAEQPLPEGFRRWTKFDDSQSTVAKFVGFQPDGKAILQSPTGKTLAVPIDQLGRAEQDFLAKQQEQSTSFPEDFREWTDVSGTKKVVAKLLGFQEGKAQFELQDGRKISARIDQFEEKELLTRLMDDATSST
jgi:predicted esterase